uniref:Neurotransmitter-gated ion-channel ligand-binding domain-containing protein n=1 Tax=Anopheles minimus TaxID=112268 RepID=A0A182VYI8_9DIPT
MAAFRAGDDEKECRKSVAQNPSLTSESGAYALTACESGPGNKMGWTWPKMGSVLLTAVFIALQFATGLANPDSKRLYDDLLSNYNRLIRPVGNNSDRLTVKMGLRLSQLIDVNLKNQIMTTNVWVEQMLEQVSPVAIVMEMFPSQMVTYVEMISFHPQ